jgi:ABC-type amino acid transport substrate-binding protein
VDVLCEATTVTLARRERMDFSLKTFVTGGTLMVRAESGLAGPGAEVAPRIGALRGTTSEEALRLHLEERMTDAEVVPFDDHMAGLAALDAAAIEGYFADYDLLVGLRAASRDPDGLVISEHFITYEPYALALRRGDDGLRLVVDRALAGLYRSGQVFEIVDNWFSQEDPRELLFAMFLLEALPE